MIELKCENHYSIISMDGDSREILEELGNGLIHVFNQLNFPNNLERLIEITAMLSAVHEIILDINSPDESLKTTTKPGI